jgi:hypothetical protein
VFVTLLEWSEALAAGRVVGPSLLFPYL